MLERTTAEVETGLRNSALPPEIAGQTISLLDVSDLVKFSKFRPDVASAIASVAQPSSRTRLACVASLRAFSSTCFASALSLVSFHTELLLGGVLFVGVDVAYNVLEGGFADGKVVDRKLAAEIGYELCSPVLIGHRLENFGRCRIILFKSPCESMVDARVLFFA